MPKMHANGTYRDILTTETVMARRMPERKLQRPSH